MVSGDERAGQRDLVRRGYDVISTAYRSDGDQSDPQAAEALATYAGWVDELTDVLPRPAVVVDLGCGAGVPGTRLLGERGYQVVGVDHSWVQLQRASALVPDAQFVHADMATLQLRAGSVDAVVSFYALIHVPLDDQLELFARLRSWLVAGGYFLAIVGWRRWTGVADYLGAPMFWDHADEATYLEELQRVGLMPLWSRFVPEADSGHTLVLARAVT